MSRTKPSDGRQCAYMVSEQTAYSVNRSEQRFFDDSGNMLAGCDQFVMRVGRNKDKRKDTRQIFGDRGKGFPVVYETNLGLVEEEYYCDTDEDHVDVPKTNEPTIESVDLSISSDENISVEEFNLDQSDNKKPNLSKLRESSTSTELEECKLDCKKSSRKGYQNSPSIFDLSTCSDETLGSADSSSASTAAQSLCQSNSSASNQKTDLDEIPMRTYLPPNDKPQNYVLKEIFEPNNGQDLNVAPKRKRGRPRKQSISYNVNANCRNPMVPQSAKKEQPTKIEQSKPGEIKKRRGRPRISEADKFDVRASGFGKGYEVEKILEVATYNENQCSLYVKFKNVEEEEIIPTRILARYVPKQLIEYYHRHLNFDI